MKAKNVVLKANAARCGDSNVPELGGYVTSRLKAHYDPLGNVIICPLKSRNLTLVCVPFHSRITCA